MIKSQTAPISTIPTSIIKNNNNLNLIEEKSEIDEIMGPKTTSLGVDPSISNDTAVSKSMTPPLSSLVPSSSTTRQPPLPTIPSSSTIDLNSPNPNTNTKMAGREKTNKKTKRKRRRLLDATSHNVPQMAIIEDDVRKIDNKSDNQGNDDKRSQKPLSYLPLNQYECVMKRRAIRKSKPQLKSDEVKKNGGANGGSPKYSILPPVQSSEMENLEKYGISLTPRESLDGGGQKNSNIADEIEIVGDTSLGMKLTILSGKVIVQGVSSLSDGRASPAQLSGKVKRGDVLLSIDGRSLVYGGVEDFNLDLLVERLKPLSTPDEDGFFARFVTVRFAVGEGLELLRKDARKGDKKKKKRLVKDNKSDEKRRNGHDRPMQDGAGEIFNISTYMTVDHFSGVSLYLDESSIGRVQEKERDSKESATSLELPKLDGHILIPTSSKNVPLNQAISMQIAWEQQSSRKRFISGYFLLNEETSALLREQLEEANQITKEGTSCLSESQMRKEMLEQGKLALSFAKRLYNQIALGASYNMDPLEVVRSECRSFSSRSRFSQRYALQRQHSDSESSGDMSSEIDNMVSDESGEEIGDEMLLKLAVWNRTWKRRMVETLEAESIHTRDREKNEERRMKKSNGGDDFSQLQNFLFGAQVTEMMNNKITVALPHAEITEVLFDLATRVTATVPHNVNIVNGLDTSFHEMAQNEIVSSEVCGRKKDEEVIEATRFLLDDILPAWMDTFKPIPIHQRRVLWPSVKENSSVANSDDLSMESAASGWSVGTPERRAKLAEKVAHLELDPHTRIETCNLVTFYFTRKILPRIRYVRKEQTRGDYEVEDIVKEAEDSAIAFVETYGSYLKLFESLVAASELYSTRLIQSLLNLAKYDPSHNDAMKLLGRNISMIPYESKMLPCLLVRLGKYVSDENLTETRNILPLIVAAYPDIKPWQIKSIMPSFHASNPEAMIEGEVLAAIKPKDIEIYFEYLSLLMDSSLMARRDQSLVREWCGLSVSNAINKAHRENFFKVAMPSIESSQLSFHRDISFLIDTSVRIKDDSLTLKLADEIISTPMKATDNALLVKMLGYLRVLGSRRDTANDGKHLNESLTTQVLTLFDKMRRSPHQICRNMIQLSDELVLLLNARTTNGSGEEEIIALMTKTVVPHELLKAISLWTPSAVSIVSIVHVLRKCLTRSIKNGIHDEISSSLLRVREIRRQEIKTDVQSHEMNKDDVHYLNHVSHRMTIWKKMENGIAPIDK